MTWFGGLSIAISLALLSCASRDPNRRVDRAERPAPAHHTPADRWGRDQRITTPERFLEHIRLLAHDDLGGRGTGSDGIDLAAGYIAGRLAALGVQPGGPNGTYFQEFIIERGAELSPATRISFEGCDATAALTEDFVPFGFSTQGEFRGELVFIGYGISNPEKTHDDYAEVDVCGRVVLMLRREPADWAQDGTATDHARFDRKVKLAAEKGVIAAFIVNQDPGADGVDGLMRFRSVDETHGLPAIHLKRAVAEKLLAAAGLPDLTHLQRRLDDENAAVSTLLDGVRAAGTVAYEKKKLTARNVIGVLPGTGLHAGEHVVVGAHFDHLGTVRGRVHNGADDNASGTAGIIEIAGALAATPQRDRGVLFIAFSGEEIGLEGSKYFVAHPTVPASSIVAMLNLDMIGRLTPHDEANRLAIQGLGTGDYFKEIVERRTSELQIPYLPDDSARGPSDHASFNNAGIPSLFFFTGVHGDYHQPGDDIEKINAEGGVQIADLVYRITLDLVNRKEAPQFAEVTHRAPIFRGLSAGGGPRVFMGIRPDFEDASVEPGWRVAEVMPGGGAEKAGIMPGDRILRINQETITDFNDYRRATDDKKPGDVIRVTLRRGGEERTLDVELAGRGAAAASPPVENQ